tara:strand:+ start:471 stop:995 length:525 start_codon:yes stop_codon:yes gene_type:complete
MKVVLVGYMGSGKTTTGLILAERLGIPFLDLDHFISEKQGMSIPDLFKNKGEVFFRKAEREALFHIGHSEDSFVLSTGGGTPCFGDNMENMKAFPNTLVVYLKLSIPELVTRLEGEMDQRPLLVGLDKALLPEFLGKHLFERAPHYEQAHLVVPALGQSPNEISQKIQSNLKSL